MSLACLHTAMREGRDVSRRKGEAVAGTRLGAERNVRTTWAPCHGFGVPFFPTLAHSWRDGWSVTLPALQTCSLGTAAAERPTAGRCTHPLGIAAAAAMDTPDHRGFGSRKRRDQDEG
jgi:hypothetical protein